ncbi:MAG: nitrilase-related carbon-nitrogen hydrolase [Halodesulfurarchaeum sp.]
MKLALVQLSISPGAPAENLERALDRIAAAAGDGADLVVLPELWNVGCFAFETYRDAAEPLDGPTMTAIADAAADHDVGILAGSIVEDLERTPIPAPASDGLANTSVLFSRAGERLATYRKQHLFGYESEEATRLTPGESLGLASFEGFTVGMTTCYDLRFPGMYRALVDEGVTLVLVPSAWPYPRLEHWEILPQARAIENLCYVAAANGVGDFEEASLLGRSAIVDPWGTTVAAAGDEPTILTADIDSKRVESVRDEFPALRDRRDRYRG